MNKTTTIIIIVVCAVIGSMAAFIYTLAKLAYPSKTPVQAHKVCDIGNYGLQNDRDRVVFVGAHQDPVLIMTNLPEAEDTLETLRSVEKKNAEKTITATISHFKNGKMLKVPITELPGPFPLVQPLSGGRYIIATASTFSPVDGFNAFVYDTSGAVLKRLKFGPDVNYIQVDQADHIWVAYDNLKPHTDPLNAAGLVCFDQDNKVISQYPNKTVDNKDRIRYAQALNVVSPTKLFICPNHASQILQVDNGISPHDTKQKLQASSSAVAFGDKATLSDQFMTEPLIYYTDKTSGKQTPLDARKDDGTSIEPHQRDFSARGSRLYFSDKKAVYFLDAQDLPQIK